MVSITPSAGSGMWNAARDETMVDYLLSKFENLEGVLDSSSPQGRLFFQSIRRQYTTLQRRTAVHCISLWKGSCYIAESRKLIKVTSMIVCLLSLLGLHSNGGSVIAACLKVHKSRVLLQIPVTTFTHMHILLDQVVGAS
jgi:hypothetical protein